MTMIIAMLLTSALFLGPLAWRLWSDARQARADIITADIRAAVNHRFRGESLLSVLVTPRLFRRAGRIVLSVPSGYEWLIEAAWRDVVSRVPPGYDLVLRAGSRRVARATEAQELPRAA